MGLAQRVALYEQLESVRGRPLIVYVTTTRPGVDSKMGSDAIPELLDQLGELPPQTEAVDLLVVSRGGDPMMAWRTMTLLHERFKHVAVLVPQVAYSAATMLAMGAHQIVMHPHGNLGPVDPQIEITKPGEPGQRFGYEDLAGFLEFAKKEVGLTDQEHIRHLFEMFCKQVGPVPIGVAARASHLTVTMGEKLLQLHLPDAKKARGIVETLNRSFFGHGYPVSRKEAAEILLPIADRNKEVEDLMWRIWLDIEDDLKVRKPFNPLFEIFSGADAAKLLGPVVQSNSSPNPPPQILQQLIQNIQIPPNAPPNLKVALVDLVAVLTEKIQPVEFDLVTAIMESRRIASHERVRGKIIACRLPDLNFRANAVATGGGWGRVDLNRTDK